MRWAPPRYRLLQLLVLGPGRRSGPLTLAWPVPLPPLGGAAGARQNAGGRAWDVSEEHTAAISADAISGDAISAAAEAAAEAVAQAAAEAVAGQGIPRDPRSSDRREAERREAERRAEQRRAESAAASFLAETQESDWSGPEARRLERFPVQGTRPIALRPLQPSGEPAGPWVLADILDISLGGLCLLVTGSLALERGQHLLLDLRAHPGFGLKRQEVEARWWMSADSFSTLGIAFPVPLASIPELALERRSVQRDPNTEAWAND